MVALPPFVSGEGLGRKLLIAVVVFALGEVGEGGFCCVADAVWVVGEFAPVGEAFAVLPTVDEDDDVVFWVFVEHRADFFGDLLRGHQADCAGVWCVAVVVAENAVGFVGCDLLEHCFFLL